MRVTELYEHYEADRLNPKGASIRTAQNYETALNCFLEYTGNRHVEEIDHKLINSWTVWIRDNCTNVTAHTYVTRFKALMRYAKLIGESSIDLDLIVVPNIPSKIPNYILPEEINALLPFCKDRREKAILTLLSSTGLRAAELLALNREDIQDEYFYVTGKGAKDRYVFVDSRARAHVGEYLKTRKDQNRALFISCRGMRLATSSLTYLLRNIGDRANRPVNAHALRHGFATDLMNNGANIHLIKELLGHSCIQITERYLHLTTSSKLAGYKQFHNRKPLT